MDPALDHDPRRQLASLHRELEAYRDGPIDAYDSTDYLATRERFWALLQRRAETLLNEHPNAGGDALAAELAADADDDWLSASVQRLPGSPVVVIALDAGFQGGTFFVAAPTSTPPVRYRVLWDVQPLARENYAARNELGRWAFPVPGFHDGPIGGRVLSLPATSGGHPRFLVDAIASAEMGMTVPGQVSVWEWNGTQAVPEFIAAYQTTYDIHEVKLEGSLVRVATKEDMDVVFSCGSCDDPRGTWTLQLEADGVRDLGHVFEEPLLKAATDLLARVVKGEDTSDVAAREVSDKLAAFVRGLREDVPASAPRSDTDAPDDPYEGVRSMLSSAKTRAAGRRRVLDLATDEWHVILTFERVAGVDYAVSVQVLE